MTRKSAPNATHDMKTAGKPAYQRPVLTELDVEATANGVVVGPQPENVSYIS
ncbi:hypothetical protein [Pelagerythrobacter sp.]|uniref:hypothetical protein n=1 Tax=Pelagerythrobacter sp. TaxID=2800702 RepID=UPI0035AE2985